MVSNHQAVTCFYPEPETNAPAVRTEDHWGHEVLVVLRLKPCGQMKFLPWGFSYGDIYHIWCMICILYIIYQYIIYVHIIYLYCNEMMSYIHRFTSNINQHIPFSAPTQTIPVRFWWGISMCHNPNDMQVALLKSPTKDTISPISDPPLQRLNHQLLWLVDWAWPIRWAKAARIKPDQEGTGGGCWTWFIYVICSLGISRNDSSYDSSYDSHSRPNDVRKERGSSGAASLNKQEVVSCMSFNCLMPLSFGDCIDAMPRRKLTF